MRDFMTPIVAILVGVATGVYTFQPIILEQLKKDNNLNPKYDEDEKLVRQQLGDLTVRHGSSESNKSDSKNRDNTN